MGKLSDLKSQREEMDWDHPDREDIEKAINSIEQWCIDNKKGYITKLTTWRKGQRKWRPFGFDEESGFISSGNFIVNIPSDKVITAKYKCAKCWNICIHHTLYNYCVKCNNIPKVIYVS